MARGTNPIKFGTWEPDKSTRQNPANEAKGVLRQQGTYVPTLSPASYQGIQLPLTCIGAAGFYDPSYTEIGRAHV